MIENNIIKSENALVSDFVLERMKKIQFDRPISVTLILEEPNVDEDHESIDTQLNELNQNIYSKNDLNNTSKEPSAIYSLNASSSINKENEELRDISSMNNKLHCNIYDSIHSKTSSLPKGANIKSSLDTSDKRKLIMLLDRISDNILLLANCSLYISNTYKNNPFKYKNALKEFSRKKDFLYKFSYTTITSIIIPLENNNTFIQKFINRTLAIAHSKSWHYITDEIVKYIFMDLIKWTKFQNQVLENKCKDQRRLPEINTNLNNILSTSTTTTDATNVCIFSHGSPGKEITINIDSQVLKNFLIEQNSNIENSAPTRNTTTITNNYCQRSMHTCKRNQNQVMQEQSTSNNNKINSKRRRC